MSRAPPRASPKALPKSCRSRTHRRMHRTQAALRAAGYKLAATVPRDGKPLYGAALPARLVLVFGAEGEGMSEPLIAAADLG